MDKSNYLASGYLWAITPDIVDESEAGNTPSITYLGFWDNGSKKFQIRRITVDNFITTTEYADGSESFSKEWADRASYNYSFLK